MDNLSSALNLNDIETLLEAVADWESLGNQDFYAMQQIKNIPIPDEEENEDLYKLITHLKKHYADKAQEIKAARAVREEKSVFVRAKLMMAKQKLVANKIWEDDEPTVKEERSTKPKKTPKEPKESKVESDDQKKFDLAVQYMTEVGAAKNFSDFLTSESNPTDPKAKYEVAVKYMTKISIINNFNTFLEEKTSSKE